MRVQQKIHYYMYSLKSGNGFSKSSVILKNPLAYPNFLFLSGFSFFLFFKKATKSDTCCLRLSGNELISVNN